MSTKMPCDGRRRRRAFLVTLNDTVASALSGNIRIVTVSKNCKQLTKIRAAAEKKFAIKDLERVHFLTPDELFALIEELNAGFSAEAGGPVSR